nr:zinc finger protein, putative [Plasmodium sp. DRC-Itaito]
MACTPLLSEEDLYRFRTKQCLRLAKGLCEFGLDRCQYSHSAEWIRRCPYYISLPSYLRYIPVACPYFIKNKNETEEDKEKRNLILKNCVHLTNKDGSVNNKFYKYIEETNINKCPLGVECPLAHSIDEIDYHPLVYKTKRCENYMHANCNKYYCNNLHGLAEQRKIKEYFIPYSNKIDIPAYPNVTIVNKIQYGSFKGQTQLSNNQKKMNTDFNFHSRNFNYPCKMINGKNYKHIDLKYNSINLPCAQRYTLQEQHINQPKRYTTSNLMNMQPSHHNFSFSYENQLKNKKKNSIFSYLNNFDDKFTLYLHILKKFPYLFDLNISDMNNDNSVSFIRTQELSDNSSKGDVIGLTNIANDDNIGISSKNNNNIQDIYEKEFSKNHSQNINDSQNKYNTFEQCTENIFMNNSYYEILNHIFKKNLQITKNKITCENATQRSFNDMEKHYTQNSSDNVDLDFIRNLNGNYINADNKIETYDDVLNMLSHILCLLYFTSDSRAHATFDAYAHKLAKQLNCESRKRKEMPMPKYLNYNMKEMI